jgi:hypothetical protein
MVYNLIHSLTNCKITIGKNNTFGGVTSGKSSSKSANLKSALQRKRKSYKWEKIKFYLKHKFMQF